VPQNLIATAVSSSQIDLTWDASTDNVAVTGYQIHRDNALIATSPTNSFSDTGLAPGTLYQYEVTAFDAASNVSARSAPASATTHQAIVTAGLVAEWRFDDGAGQTLTDYSGNGHHGQLGPTSGVEAADPTWAATGLTFVAANNEFVEIQSPEPISGSTNWTVIYVVKSGGAANQAIFSEGSSSSGNPFLACFMTPTGQRVQYRDNSATIICDVTSAVDIFNNAWRFAAIRRNGTTLTIVADGTSQNFVIGSGATLTLNRQGFGALLRTANSSFAGVDVAYGVLYNTNLSDAQIQQVRSALTTILAARGITLP
jgi:hypothetical protein